MNHEAVDHGLRGRGRPDPRSRWTDNDGVRIHYLDSGDDPGVDLGMTPLVFVPGFGEEALDHPALIEALAPRRVVIPDLRGRGPSDRPAGPYDLAAHVADLHSVIEAAELTRLHIASYSRGTAYALRWAVDHPDRLASVSVGDYPAAQIAPPLEAIPALQARERFGRPFTDRIPAEIIALVIEQAHSELYYDRLSELTAPLMVIHGTRRSALVKEEVQEAYREARPDVVFVAVDDGHDLWRNDPRAVPDALRDFLERSEAGR